MQAAPPAADRIEPVPNFFIVGAPKCATTSMDDYLAQHPEIFMYPLKEPHYFAEDLYWEQKRDWDAKYWRTFGEAGDEPVVGESSVFYMLSETAAAAIHAHQPRAKILVMLRNPVDVIASHHSQIVYEALEPEADLERALALEARRKAEAAGRRTTFRDRVLHYRDVVAFAEQIERFLERFPREQVHVVFFDDLRRDPAGTYRDVLAFLGVDTGFVPRFEVQNANKRARSGWVTDFLRYTPDWVSAASRMVLPKREWRKGVRQAIKRANTRFVPRPPMSDALRARLTEELAPEVERLGRLLGRDLSDWSAPPS